MTDFDDFPSIDDPGHRGGGAPEPHPLPPGDSADDTGAPGEPQPAAADLDLPGPDDPVAWSYVEPGTQVVGPDDEPIGRVAAMLGTEEGIFHGVAIEPDHDGGVRSVPSSQVTLLTTRRVRVSLDREGLQAAEEYHEPGG